MSKIECCPAPILWISPRFRDGAVPSDPRSNDDAGTQGRASSSARRSSSWPETGLPGFRFSSRVKRSPFSRRSVSRKFANAGRTSGFGMRTVARPRFRFTAVAICRRSCFGASPAMRVSPPTSLPGIAGRAYFLRFLPSRAFSASKRRVVGTLLPFRPHPATYVMRLAIGFAADLTGSLAR